MQGRGFDVKSPPPVTHPTPWVALGSPAGEKGQLALQPQLHIEDEAEAYRYKTRKRHCFWLGVDDVARCGVAPGKKERGLDILSSLSGRRVESGGRGGAVPFMPKKLQNSVACTSENKVTSKLASVECHSSKPWMRGDDTGHLSFAKECLVDALGKKFPRCHLPTCIVAYPWALAASAIVNVVGGRGKLSAHNHAGSWCVSGASRNTVHAHTDERVASCDYNTNNPRCSPIKKSTNLFFLCLRCDMNMHVCVLCVFIHT